MILYLKYNNINDRATEKKIACIYNGIIVNNKKTWKKHSWIQNWIIFIIEAFASASAGVGNCWWLVQPHESRSSPLTLSVCQPLSLTRSLRIPNACTWAFFSVRHLAAKARNRINRPAMALWGYVLACRSWLIDWAYVSNVDYHTWTWPALRCHRYYVRVVVAQR